MSKENEGGADGSFGSPPGDRAAWDADGPDRECDCPGPPPRFYLPPPPRPFFLLESDCSENSTSRLDSCEAVPVIDAEYQYGPAVPSLAIILSVAFAVAVFLLIGTFLVLLKKRKMRNLFPRKSSPQNRCDAASANGVIYEDLTNVRPRMLPSHCLPGQTTLPSIEMIDVASYPDRAGFGSSTTCPAPLAQDSFDSRELFNPVYEELSNGSGEGGETDSDGMPRAAASEDDFAEDELSFGGDAEFRRGREDEEPGEPDSSDSDDECKFLENTGRDSSLPPDQRDKGKNKHRGSYFRSVPKKPKVSEGKKVRRNKELPPLPEPPDGGRDEFREGFLLQRILQIYPDVTGMGPRCACGPPNVQRSDDPPTGCDGRYESLEAFAGAHLRRPKPEIFSTFGPMQGFGKNQNQDSDSGYSNNTSGGKSSSRTRKEYRLTNRGENAVLS